MNAELEHYSISEAAHWLVCPEEMDASPAYPAAERTGGVPERS